MSGEQNWRVPVDAETYFKHQQKAQAVADRRPVIRKAADLVGPGINAAAIPITDFSDPLATYNGFFSAVAGAFGAPNSTEAFVGMTINDATMGGTQTFQGLTTRKTFSRTFTRNPADLASLFWTGWAEQGTNGFEIGMLAPYVGAVSPSANWLICNGSTFSGASYPVLATRLGSTTLPDLRDRTIYGVGSAWALLATDGLALGARTKTLLMDHTHTIFMQTGTGGSHSHPISVSVNTATLPSNTTTGGGAVQRLGPDTTHNHTASGSSSADGTHDHTVWGTTDAGTATPVVTRGVGMNWLIRAAL